VEKASIVIALKNEQAAEKIRLACQQDGYLVSEVCTSGSEAIRRVRAEAPDILLIDFDMPDITGLEAATIVGDEDLCSVVLLVSPTQRDLSWDLVEDYDVTLCAKPISRMGLLSTLEVVLQNRRRYLRLERELSELKRGMEDRKLIERAKGILMKYKGIPEDEAYRRIQRMSMDSRVAMRDIAIRIIELAEKMPKA
jgi:AmiR/NasT family two-component response regulator